MSSTTIRKKDQDRETNGQPFNFLGLPLKTRENIYRLVIERKHGGALMLQPSPDCIPINPVTNNCTADIFFKRAVDDKLDLKMMSTSKQVQQEMTSVLFDRPWYFPNLDTLLATLVHSPKARINLKHVDINLIVFDNTIVLHALRALAQLDLDTLTLRCAMVDGDEEKWSSSEPLSYLFETRGVRKVVFARPSFWYGEDDWLNEHDPLGQRIIALLQRPCLTPRNDPEFQPIMPDGYVPGPNANIMNMESLTDFDNVGYYDETLSRRDPLCRRHRELHSCHCSDRIDPEAVKKKLDLPPSEYHWSQSGHKDISPEPAPVMNPWVIATPLSQ